MITGSGDFLTNLAAIRSNGISTPLTLDVGHAYDATHLARTAWLQPVREQRAITLSFAAHNPPTADYIHVARCISHVLGHEGVFECIDFNFILTRHWISTT